MKTPISLIVLVTVLAVFVLNAFPARARDYIDDILEAQDYFARVWEMDHAAYHALKNDPTNNEALRKLRQTLYDYSKESEAIITTANREVTPKAAQFALTATKGIYEDAVARVENAGIPVNARYNILEASKEKAGPGFFDCLRKPGECLVYASSFLLLGIVRLLGQLIAKFAALVEGVINWAEFAEAPIVQEGWRIVRDFANMLFALVLLIIAFATILHIETFGMKALLPKLIIAALLINFSLVIAVIPIDFANILTIYFVTAAGGENFSVKIADSLNLAEVLAKNNDISFGEGLLALLNVLGGLIMAIIFSLIILFVFLALTILLIIRIVYIWFLLILAPIVWLLWILPQTRPLFHKWWNKFLQWTFFAPIYAFFLYLALKTYSTLIKREITEAINSRDFNTLVPKILSGENILQYILMVAILLGGLIAAQKMGIYGAQGMVGFAQGVGKKVRQWTAKRAKIAVTPAAEAIGKGMAFLGRAKVVGGIFRQMARPFRYAAEKEREAVAKEKDYYKNWTEADLKKQSRAVDPRAKLAIAQILAERGELNTEKGFREKDIAKALKIAKRYEQHRDILKARPDLAPIIYEDIQETIGRIKPSDMGKLQSEAIALSKTIQDKIKNKEKLTSAEEDRLEKVTLTTSAILHHLKDNLGKWRSNHLSAAADNPKFFVELRKNIVQPNSKTLRQDIKIYLNNWAGQNLFGI